MKISFDTNILVYATASVPDAKARRARDLIARAMRAGWSILLLQALAEFANVAIRKAGHLGRIGAWAEQVAQAGLASLHFVNTSGFGILVAAHGGMDRRLSANPIAAGAPGPDGAPLVLDMSTSAIAEGKIQVAHSKGADLPPGCIVDKNGRPSVSTARPRSSSTSRW